MKKSNLSYFPIVYTFEEFQKTQLKVHPDSWDRIDEFDQSVIDTLKYMLIYGGCVTENGIVDGCVIEQYNDGTYQCTVCNDGIHTSDLQKAEQYLYNEWYKWEYQNNDSD